MKFAFVEGERREAQPGQSAECPGCDQAMIAKCGEFRIWHWAHERTGTCDFEWEPETKWHRDWKNQFPEDRQECPCSKDGKKRIADVMTESGMVIEFQHSHLRRGEREARESFYQNMVWVVDGRRLKLDRARFFKSLWVTTLDPLTVRLPSSDRLLRNWVSSRVPVYFDFGDTSEPDDTLRFSEPVLWRWRLDPRNPNGTAFLRPVTKAVFLKTCLKGLPLKFCDYSTVERARAEHEAFLQHMASKLNALIRVPNPTPR
jgi:competence protein CoiA